MLTAYRLSPSFYRVPSLQVWSCLGEHPHIGSLVRAFQCPAAMVFVVEYYSGGQLCNMLSNRPGYSEKDARQIARQALLGLAHLHRYVDSGGCPALLVCRCRCMMIVALLPGRAIAWGDTCTSAAHPNAWKHSYDRLLRAV